MKGLVMLVAMAGTLGAEPDGGAAARRQARGGGQPAMAAEVRALFGDLIEPVTGAEAHWSVPLFDRRTTNEIFLVTITKDLPRSIVGVQIWRFFSQASVGQRALVVVGSGGPHLVISGLPLGGALGVYSGSACGPGVGGLSLGGSEAGEWRACWSRVRRRFEVRQYALPQVELPSDR